MRNKKILKSIFLRTLLVQNAILILWRIFQPTSLIIDQAALVIILSGLVFSLIVKKKSTALVENRKLEREINILKFVASSLLFLVWILSVPGTVERSRSLAIFKWVQFDSKVHTISEIENALQQEYHGFELDGFRLRLHEHCVRGLMSVDSRNKVNLTLFGEMVFTSAEITAFVYRLNGWYDIPLGPNK